MAVMCQGCAAELETWTGRCPHCGSMAQVELRAPQDPLLGKIVGGRYKVMKKLGQGGMGSVYLAEHTGVGQRVAVKFLNPSFSGDPDVVRRFLNEARSYGQITHPHAVQLHDFGQDEEGNLFISMEYIEGLDLKRTLEQERRLPLKDALDIVLQVCDVLGHAHSKAIVHRDLKPENIMLVKGLRGYHAKVLDFGVARLMAEQTTRLTAAGSICGTPRYMSPEQAEGGEVDHRADIYALGLVLFECVTGTHPFQASSIAETLRKQVAEPMPHLADVVPEMRLPPGLDAAIQKATAKNREERFWSMTELARPLVDLVPTSTFDSQTVPTAIEAAQTILNARQVQEKTSHSGSPYGRPTRVAGPRWLGPATVVVGLVLAAGVASWALLRPPAKPEGWDDLAKAAASDESGAKPEPGEAAPAPESAALLPSPAPAAPANRASSLAPAPSSATAVPSTEVVPVPAAAPPVSASRKPGAPAKAAPAGGGELAAVRLLAETGMYTQAQNEFLTGRLETSAQILKSIPTDSAVRGKVVALQKDIDELQQLMAKAGGLYRQGRCAEAIRIYQDVQGRNPGIRAAGDGIARCRKEMPVGTID